MGSEAWASSCAKAGAALLKPAAFRGPPPYSPRASAIMCVSRGPTGGLRIGNRSTPRGGSEVTRRYLGAYGQPHARSSPGGSYSLSARAGRLIDGLGKESRPWR